MLRDALHFFVSLAEVIVAVGSILIAGVTIAKIAFWIVSRILGMFAGPPAGSDSNEDEMDDYVTIPSPLEGPSIPREDVH